MTKHYFQLVDGKAAKYWHIDLSKNSHVAHYGRIGSQGQTTTKTFVDAKTAKTDCEKLIRQKLNKGYVAVTAKVAAEHTKVPKTKTATKNKTATQKVASTKKKAATQKKAATKQVVAKKATPAKGTTIKLDVLDVLKSLRKKASGYDQNQLGQMIKSGHPKVDTAELFRLAGKWNAVDVVKKLVDAHFDFNAAGNNGKFYTADPTITKLVIDAGFDVKQHGHAWIATAASQGKPRVVELLLAAGACPNHFESGYGWTLDNAINEGRTEVVKLLVDAGADPVNPSQKGEPSPISLAAQNGKLELVDFLLQAGADPNIQSDNGFDALMEASRVKGAAQPEIVRRLLSAGADYFHASKVGWTALMCAAQFGSSDVIQVLVEHGADVNWVTEAGTALTSAAKNNRADNAKLLLKLGADPLLSCPATAPEDYRGKNALEVAQLHKSRDVISLLESAAGKGAIAGAKVGDKKKSAASSSVRKTTTIAKSWKRIEAWLSANDPDRLKSLGKPVKPDQFSKLEKTIGCKLPVEVKQLYQVHDGQSYQSFLIELPDGGDYFLLPTKEVIREWKTWKDLVDNGEFDGLESNPEKGIRGDQWFNPKWIPIFANGGGDSYCVDLDPAKGGKKGQVISMNHDNKDRSLIADSLTALLSQLADQLEQR
ncbi:MAG: ankyrin repeat domain-containing protein [Planctomycetales bacterium]|nr:ankyrin repeat domain-containing protein [Planctomycetales bacterium]